MKRYHAQVRSHRQLSETGFELTLDRLGLEFNPGELILVHGREATDDRSYTLASGTPDEHLQLLYRYIPEGKLTPQLRPLSEGDTVEFSGPFGEFTVRDTSRPIIFVATGTGVAPCRSYQRSHPELNLTLLHGVRHAEDLFYKEEFEALTGYRPCITAEEGTWFHGRVTALLETMDLDPETHFYLCGSNEMILDVFDLLGSRGFDRTSIFTEAYYRRLETLVAP